MRHTSPPLSSAPSPSLCARTVQSNVRNLPCPSRPSPSLLRFSGLLASLVCPTSLALPVSSSLVPTSPRCMTLCRHVAHCTFGGGLPSGSTMRRPGVQSPPRATGGQLGCGAPFLFLPLVRSNKPGHTMCIHWSVSSTPARPFPLAATSYPLPSGQREHGAGQFARQPSPSAPPLRSCTLALSCPLSARPPSPSPAPLPGLQGLWPSVSLSPSSLYPPGVHCAEPCARQRSHSLYTFLPPGVLVSWQVARTLHCTRLRPFSLYAVPRGLLWPPGPLVPRACPASPSLPCPFPLMTLCRKLCRAICTHVAGTHLASTVGVVSLSGTTPRPPAAATASARAAAAGSHSKCRGVRGPGRRRMPPGEGFAVPPAAPGRRRGSITKTCKNRKKIAWRSYLEPGRGV